MTQSQQTSERKFIAVHFRGIQQLSRERTAIEIHGTAGIDVLASLPSALPVPEELEPDASPRSPAGVVGAVSLSLGNEAARAAYAYAALGGAAAFTGTVGDDPVGEVVLRWLSDRGVDVSRVAKTGTTPVRLLLAPAGQAALAIGGASEPDTALPARGWNGATSHRSDQTAPVSRTLLVAGYPHVGALRGARARDLLRDARARGLTTVISLSPVQLGGEGRPLAPDELAELLPEADWVCGGAPEMRRATRRADPQDAARALLDAGVRAVLAKRGPDGAAVFRAGSSGLAREDTATPTAAAMVVGLPPVRLAAAFGAVYDAAFLLGQAVNDSSPIRFAAVAAARAAASPSGVLGIAEAP